MPAVTPAPVERPLRRDPAHGLLGGVCSGIAARLGVEPLLLRAVFAGVTIAGGVGIVLYAVLWWLLPADGDAPEGRRFVLAGGAEDRAGRRRHRAARARGDAASCASGGCGPATSWSGRPSLIASGAALLWHQSRAGGAAATAAAPAAARPRRRASASAAAAAARARRRRRTPRSARARHRRRRSSSCGSTTRSAPARDVILAGRRHRGRAALILAPCWLRLVRGLIGERAERIRSQERAEIAAHLHDSVLQTLALVQKRADDPREVAALARRQERELRAWLNDGAAARRRRRTLAARARGRGGRGRGRARRRRSRSSRSATGRSTSAARRSWPRRARRSLNAAKFAGQAPRSRVRRGRAASGSRCSCATAGRASTSPPCRPTGAACASRSSGAWSATAAGRRCTRARARAPRSSW